MCSVMSCWLPKVSYGGNIYIKEIGKIHKSEVFCPLALPPSQLLNIYQHATAQPSTLIITEPIFLKKKSHLPVAAIVPTHRLIKKIGTSNKIAIQRRHGGRRILMWVT